MNHCLGDDNSVENLFFCFSWKMSNKDNLDVGEEFGTSNSDGDGAIVQALPRRHRVMGHLERWALWRNVRL